MVAVLSSVLDVRDHFPRGTSIYLLFNSDILNLQLKANVGGHRRSSYFYKLECLNFLIWQLSGAEILIQSRLNQICCDANLLCSWFYSTIGEAGWVQDFIFLFLMLIKGMRRRGKFKIPCVTPGMEGFFLVFRELLKNRECGLEVGCGGMLRT